MNAVLHIEPINRPTQAPISVGHNDFIFYGEHFTDDDENLGTPSSSVLMGSPLRTRAYVGNHYEFTVGCPLETVDAGNTRATIPLVKTLEYTPDFSRPHGYVFSETLHYMRRDKTLIPYRSKIRSGLGLGLRINHLPSLNLARGDISGERNLVCDPRSQIVTEILLQNEEHQKRQNPALRDWLTYELSPKLQNPSVNHLSFGVDSTRDMINRYISEVRNTSTELTVQNTNRISSILLEDNTLAPSVYKNQSALIRPIHSFREAMVNHSYDFSSWGSICPENLPRMIYNPLAFQNVCELIDRIPLTDFNVDLVITPSSEVAFYFEHVAVDRFCVFDDNDLGAYTGKTIISEYLDGIILNGIINQFMDLHPGITEEINHLLLHKSIKIKLIKTITDEAAVLLYDAESKPNDPPLCGVYFDIAIQSLAPMSIISEVVN